MAFNSTEEKYHYVNHMFARIAHRYDVMNRIMTGGQDVKWRKQLINNLNLPPQGTLLDVATGTGAIAFTALQQRSDLAHVAGLDFTIPMMQAGQHRFPTLPQRTHLSWSGGDALRLPFPANQFDAVVSGFMMRNVIDVQQALAEQVRVCKPGGRVAVLEIPRPANTLWGRLFRLYFHNVVPLVGGIISGQRDAYSYLPSSADLFLRPSELKTKMEQVDLRDVTYTMLMFHTVALHVGVK